MGRSSFAGEGSVKPLSLLSRELKKPFHSSSSACSLKRAVLSLFLTFKIFCGVLSRECVDKFLSGCVVPGLVSHSKVFHLFVSAAASSTLYESLKVAFDFLHLSLDNGDFDTIYFLLASSLSVFSSMVLLDTRLGRPQGSLFANHFLYNRSTTV